MNNKIRTMPKEHCYLCGSKGNKLYTGIRDRLFGVKGKWNIDKCSNNDCGLLWINPMPILEDLPKLYETYYTHTIAPKKTSGLVQVFRNGCSEYIKKKYKYPYNSSIFSRLVAILIKLNPEWTANLDFSVFYLPAIPNGKLLEIGCGSGDMLKDMQNKGWDVTGVDFDSKSVSVAQNLGLNVYEGDISQLNLEKNSFDAIVMNHVIEHLPDFSATLDQCYQLLKPTGQLVITTPNSKGYNHRVFKINSRILEQPRHLFIFNKSTLTRAIDKSGFNKIECSSSIRGFSWLYWISKSISLKKCFSIKDEISYKKKIIMIIPSIIASFFIKIGLYEGDELVVIASKNIETR